MKVVPAPRDSRLRAERVPFRSPVERVDATFPAQGYELRMEPDGVSVSAGDDAGLFYGRLTLDQLRAADGTLPAGIITDHPDMAVRGVMLDISRDKVPTMATLRDIVSRLASWKVNHLELYSEHTFAYPSHPDVHRRASPITAAEIRELDEFCRARHIELVPNQNCLGHMNRWLCHERYRPLAISPDGFVDPFGMARPAMTIEPTNPASLPFVRGLLGELLPHFSSRRVHVGLDEAWELPRSRAHDYLAWMSGLRSVPELDGREMLVWGDMLSGEAAWLQRVPAGVTVCEWGYDDSYPFDERCRALAAASVPFWVAPGTSSWLSIGGRLSNAVATCRNAVDAAIAHGATGFLNTDWGDQGHLQQLPISEPGLLFGAAVSWCAATNRHLDLQDALSTHAFADPTGGMAEALLLVGDVHRVLTPQFPNMSTLTLHLYFPQMTFGQGLTRGVWPEELDQVEERLARARAATERSQSSRADSADLIRELQWSVDLLELLTHDARARLAGDGRLESVPEPARRAMAASLHALIDRYRDLWLVRNRPGGLRDSVSWLDNLQRAYRSGRPDPSWGGWRTRRES